MQTTIKYNNLSALFSLKWSIHLATLIVACINWSNLSAQKNSSSNSYKYISTNFIYGKVDIHDQNVQNLNNTNPTGISIDYGKHDFSTKALSTYGTNLRFGTNLQLWQFNNTTLGKGVAITIYGEPFLLVYDKFMLSIKGSIGIIGLSNPYDSITNSQNKAYSSAISIPIALGLSAYKPINYNWALTSYLSYNRITNGGIKQPNYGLNYWSISFGVERNLNSYNTQPKAFNNNIKLPKQQKFNTIDIISGVAYGQNNSDTIVTAILQTRYNHRLTLINGIGAGIFIEANNENKSQQALSLTIGHKFYLGRFGFSQDLNYYIFNSNNNQPAISQLYAIDYLITNHLILGANIKSHGLEAQYLGIRVGYAFKLL